jgi:hypothetical protein
MRGAGAGEVILRGAGGGMMRGAGAGGVDLFCAGTVGGGFLGLDPEATITAIGFLGSSGRCEEANAGRWCS